MELKLLNFIKEHENWREIITNPPFSVTVKEDSINHLFLFKYSPMTIWNKEDNYAFSILEECRGAIYYIEGTTVECVHMGLKKFFNLEEPSNRVVPDLEKSVVFEKIDGSNVSFWYWNNAWHCSSLGCIDANDAELSCGRTLLNLVNETLGMPFQEFCENFFERDYSYVFEITHPENRIVIEYKNAMLWPICRRSHLTWEESTMRSVAFYPFGFIKSYNFNSLENLLETARHLPDDEEGYVVYNFETHERVKVKGLRYLELHRLRGNGTFGLNVFFDLHEAETLDDFLAAFPQFQNQALGYMNAVYSYCHSLDQNWDFVMNDFTEMYGDTKNKALFAHFIKDHAYKAYLFSRWDGKCENGTIWFSKLTNHKKAQIIEHYMEADYGTV